MPKRWTHHRAETARSIGRLAAAARRVGEAGHAAPERVRAAKGELRGALALLRGLADDTRALRAAVEPVAADFFIFEGAVERLERQYADLSADMESLRQLLDELLDEPQRVEPSGHAGWARDARSLSSVSEGVD